MARAKTPAASTTPAPDYLKKILTARVYDVAIESPLEPARSLSRRVGNAVLLKREDQQPVFSFKLRGAYNKMAHLSAAELAKGVICASAGNHAQGVALSAKKLGCRAVVVMPVTTPRLKVDAVAALGGEVLLFGDSFSDAYGHALQVQKLQGLVFVHPFDDPDVIAGQGTIAMEILRQHEGPIDAIFVAIGGGGLISGVASYIKAVRPEIKDFVVVDTDEVCAAIKDVFQDTRSILEPAGALGVAGIKQYVAQHKLKGKTLVAITCGANMNFDRLRFVAERADFGEQREALFAVTIPEERGSFKRFCELVGPRSVTEFNYRISDAKVAHVFVGLAIHKRDEADKIARNFVKHGFATVDLTDDELAKEHVRHMVGGRSALAADERLFRFVFPERPGALMRFLSSLHPEWNISLFHYRNQGADDGRILVGIQVPSKTAADRKAFKVFLDTLAYPCVEESSNPVYQLFLR